MKFRFLVLEPSVLALDIYHSSRRNSLPFTSLRSVTIGSGRDFLEGDACKGQSRGLLGPVDPVPVVAGAVGKAGATTVEVQAVRGAVVPRAST